MPDTLRLAGALPALCDGVPLRGPESKIVVARAQAALIEALQEGQPHGPLRAPRGSPSALGKAAPDAVPDDRSANPASLSGRQAGGPGRPSGGPQS